MTSQTYYDLIKNFESLLESNKYHDQVIQFMICHFEKHLDQELLEDLKNSLSL